MERQVLTYPLEKEQVHKEISFFVEYYSNKSILYCDVLFGFAWGHEYYPSKEWLYEEIELSRLIQKVDEVEASGIGAVSEDDLFIKIDNLEFRFCNDSDIHIYFTEANKDIEFFYSRWKELDYQPAEWLKNKKNSPGKRVRHN